MRNFLDGEPGFCEKTDGRKQVRALELQFIGQLLVVQGPGNILRLVIPEERGVGNELGILAGQVTAGKAALPAIFRQGFQTKFRRFDSHLLAGNKHIRTVDATQQFVRQRASFAGGIVVAGGGP